ncbi:MAG TPA: methyltransferase domain-containing protein [Thermoplasmata archaeon]|nr:methyltransferase domain-containing protein [Thermoplasmata archaeon]
MSTTAGRETVTSYEGFDFRRAWADRAAVTRAEAHLLATALGNRRVERLLEAGTGFGRLSGTLASRTDEYVGADLDATQLASVPSAVRESRARDPDLLAVANLFHLPFAAATFRAVVSVRVYHHIRDSAAFLSELARVTEPGGTLVLSYNPKPTIATLQHDVRGFLDGRPTKITFDRRSVLECDGGPFPIVVPTIARVRQDVRDAGFEILRELAEGPERLAAWVSDSALERSAPDFPASFFFPTRFLVARRAGNPPGELLPLRSSLACPRCRAPAVPPSLDGPWEWICSACGQRLALHERLLAAAYAPAGTEWRRATGSGPGPGSERGSGGGPGESAGNRRTSPTS